jgi:SDR family mycofactocin-dependent oxidoreductase
MTTLKGKTAVVTGAARGQGRSHAVNLARKGVNVAMFDVCANVGTAYDGATPEDLAETQRLVEAEGVKATAEVLDVRDAAGVQSFIDTTIETFGSVEILLANAGIQTMAPFPELSGEAWQTTIDIDLTGVFNTIRAVIPHMIERRYGRVVATSSMGGRQAYGNCAHYIAAKFGVIGLVKAAAIDTGPYGITVNAICPTSVDTHLIKHQQVYDLFGPELESPTLEDIKPRMNMMHPQNVPWIECQDVSDAVMFLVSDEAKFITGEALTVSAGLIASNSA